VRHIGTRTNSAVDSTLRGAEEELDFGVSVEGSELAVAAGPTSVNDDRGDDGTIFFPIFVAGGELKGVK